MNPFEQVAREKQEKRKLLRRFQKTAEEGNKIHFYYLDYCGHCKTMKRILEPYHAYIEYKDAAEKEVRDYLQSTYPNEARGFPFFTWGDKHLIGAVHDLSQFMDRLEIPQ